MRDRGRRKSVSTGSRERTSCLLASPCALMQQALQLEGLGHDEIEDDPHILEESSKSSQLISPAEKYIQS